MIRFLFSIYLVFICTASIYAQSKVVEFKILFKGEEFSLNKSYSHPTLQDSIQFEKLSFYISDCKAITASNNEITLDKRFHLLHFNDSNQIDLGEFKTNETIKSISFILGIDSITNVSGVMGGDLDPIHGMYWAWQSGYINFKLEGTSPLCNTRKNRFQFHIGGYANSFKSAQKVVLDNIANKDSITIALSLDRLFEVIDLKESSAIMSPSMKAVNISQLIANSFQLE